jgi:hypothetical protein
VAFLAGGLLLGRLLGRGLLLGRLLLRGLLGGRLLPVAFFLAGGLGEAEALLELVQVLLADEPEGGDLVTDLLAHQLEQALGVLARERSTSWVDEVLGLGGLHLARPSRGPSRWPRRGPGSSA